MKKLKKSVLLALIYHKALDTPLSLIQLDRYLLSKESIKNFSLMDLKKALHFWKEKEFVDEQKGLHQISDNSSFWQTYVQQEKNSQRKIRGALRTIKYLSFIPYLRSLFICGSVARKTCKYDSDIDFLILTKKNRVWTVRLLLTVTSILLGRKTRDEFSRDNKFCLNHYRARGSYLLEKNMQDIYSASEYSHMLNVFSDGNEQNVFFKKNMKWMKKILPQFDFIKPPIYKLSRKTKRALEKVFDKTIGDKLENILYRMQLLKIKTRSSRMELPSNARLVANKGTIIFHLSPRAPETNRRFEQILAKKTGKKT